MIVLVEGGAATMCFSFDFRQQLYHEGKERRLRAAEKIAAVAVGNKPNLINQPGKIVHHRTDEVHVPIHLEADHSEVIEQIVKLKVNPDQTNWYSMLTTALQSKCYYHK